MKQETTGLTIRPYQLVSIIGRLGAGRPAADLGDPELTRILNAIAQDPRIPVTFRLYDGEKYNGCDKDAPEGVLFHMYRDWAILERLGLARNPSRTYAIHAGLFLLMDAAGKITTLEGINYFATVTGPAWKGTAEIREEDYQKGREKIREFCKSILPQHHGFFTLQQQAEVKRASAAGIFQADTLRIFPSHLFFVLGTHAAHAEFPAVEPLHHDNLVEVWEAMRRNPEIPVMLVPGHCMVCPPCGYDPEGPGLCGVHPLHLKPVQMANFLSLQVLQTLGLEYYQPMPAIQLIKRAFARMPLDHIQFTYQGSPPSAYSFARSRYIGAGFIEAHENLEGVMDRVAALLKRREVTALLPEIDRAHAETILAQARQALAAGDRKQAYALVTDHRFWSCWKIFMERVLIGYARLPKGIKIERPIPGPSQAGTLSGHPRDGEVVPQPRERGSSTKPTACLTTGLAGCHECRVLPAARVAGRIVGDGRLTEDAWKKGVFSAGFQTLMERPAIAETAVQALYDRQNLYVGFMCAEKNPAALKMDARLGADLKQNESNRYDYLAIDDVVLVVLQPDERQPKYFNFIVNAKGVKLGDWRDQTNGRKSRGCLYETDWQAATRIGKNYWSGEMAIPFACLGTRGPGTGKWRINFHRFFGGDRLDTQSWSYAGRKIDNLEKLGRLEFG